MSNKEASARIKINNLLEESGWRFFDDNQGRANIILENQAKITQKVIDEYGNIRSDEHGYMDGGDVFNFVIKEVPQDIKRVLELSGKSLTQIDYFIFHQANSFINNYLINKLKIDPDKTPSTVGRFGNTSSVSIPLTIVSELKGRLKSKNLLLSGFGVGMTWASCQIYSPECHLSDIVEY